MKIRRFFGIGCILLSTLSTFAQLGANKRVVLTNGNSYKGIIISETDSIIKLVTPEDHTLSFNRIDIVEILGEGKQSKIYISALENQRKWYSTTNVLCDFDALDQLGFGIETFLGIKHNKYFQNGFGVGFKQNLGWFNYEPLTIHLALQNRFNLMQTGSTPFISYEPAYLIMPSNANEPNYYKHLAHSFEIGFRKFKPEKERSFNISMALLRRVGVEYYDYNRKLPHSEQNWQPEYKLVMKLGWQL